MIEIDLDPEKLECQQPSELKVRLKNTATAACTSIVLKVKLPGSVLLLQGSDRIDVPRLAAGESFTHSLRVKPSRTGHVTVTSSNFSYRDSRGASRRICDLELPLEVMHRKRDVKRVEPMDVEGQAELQVRIRTSRLELRMWDSLEGEVVNLGDGVAEKVRVSVRGPLTLDSSSAWQDLGTLEGKEKRRFCIPVRADESGRKVPLRVFVHYGSPASGKNVEQAAFIRVDDEDRSAPPSHRDRGTGGIDEVTRVLFLAANPAEETRLRLGKEYREIQEKIKMSKDRDRFDLDSCMALRPQDVSQALHDVRPRIVHFSGHGTEYGALCFENDEGLTQQVDSGALAALFSLVAEEVECVLLNACYSEIQAEAIGRHIRYVIGMSEAVSDKAAIAFSTGFYQALGGGRSIPAAYEFGCTQIRLQGIQEYLVPVILEA